MLSTYQLYCLPKPKLLRLVPLDFYNDAYERRDRKLHYLNHCQLCRAEQIINQNVTKENPAFQYFPLVSCPDHIDHKQDLLLPRPSISRLMMHEFLLWKLLHDPVP